MGMNAYKDLERLVRACFVVLVVVAFAADVHLNSRGDFTGSNGRPILGMGKPTYASFVARALQDEAGADGRAH